MAAYQSRVPSYATQATWPFLGEFFQLGFLFETESPASTLTPLPAAG